MTDAPRKITIPNPFGPHTGIAITVVTSDAVPEGEWWVVDGRIFDAIMADPEVQAARECCLRDVVLLGRGTLDPEVFTRAAERVKKRLER